MKTPLQIEDMSCEHCVKHVTEALEAVPGVKSAKVSLKAKNAVVDHQDDVSLVVLKDAVVEAGYTCA
jgi:copper chaperone CopZ